MARATRLALAVSLLGALAFEATAEARPNTHAPAVSTWDPRASSVVLGLGSAVSGQGSFSFTSYNANFSSTNGILSAQFGVHYVRFQDTDEGPTARGVSAGGVALVSIPLSERFQNGVPGSAFAFYIGGVPTALYSGELNYISVPLVLGVGLPFSPVPYITFRPWVELSPALNFDTRIDEISTDSAIQAAMDGVLTRDEVEDLVSEGLNIERETTVGKRGGISVALHLGERVDIDLNMMLGAGHAGALSVGAGLVLRWDAMVANIDRSGDGRRGGDGDESCAEIAARYHRECPARPPAGAHTPTRPVTPGASAEPRWRRTPGRTQPARPRPPQGALAPARRPLTPSPAATPSTTGQPAPSSLGAGAPTGTGSTTTTKKPATNAPATAPAAAPVPRPKADELPPLQAAPPRTP